MTREEAIEWLKEMKDTIELYNALSNSYTFDKYPQAIDMAIEALSNQQKWIDEELQNYLIEHADLVNCKDCEYGEERHGEYFYHRRRLYRCA